MGAQVSSIQSRDADTLRQLHAAGWLPVVVWEHEDMATVACAIAALDRTRRARLTDDISR